MVTRCAYAHMIATSVTLISLIDKPSTDLPLGPLALKAPLMTFHKLRFIALHINTVRIVPALPTRIPPVSMTWLSYKNPPQAAAIPVNEFNNEITTGISAPPIGMTNNTPYTREDANTTQINPSLHDPLMERKMINARMAKTIVLLAVSYTHLTLPTSD